MHPEQFPTVVTNIYKFFCVRQIMNAIHIPVYWSNVFEHVKNVCSFLFIKAVTALRCADKKFLPLTVMYYNYFVSSCENLYPILIKNFK